MSYFVEPIHFSTVGKFEKILNMVDKLILVGVVLIFLSNSLNSDAFLTESLYDVFNCVNPFHSSPSTALRAIGDGSHSEGTKDHRHNVRYHLQDVRDDLSIQKVILQIRLKAAKHFIQERKQFLKFTEEKNWKINKTLLTQKRKDVETAESDVTIIEEALENPTEFKDVILIPDEKEKNADEKKHE